MNKSLFYILLCILCINCGGSKNEKSPNKIQFLKGRLEFIDQMRSDNFARVIEINPTAKEFNKYDRLIGKMQKSIIHSIENQSDSVFLDEFVSEFKNQNYFDCSFLNKGALSIENGLSAVERITYNIGTSALCNDYFIFDAVSINKEWINPNQLRLKWDVNSFNFIESLLIKNKFSDTLRKIIEFYPDDKQTTVEINPGDTVIGVYFRKYNKVELLKL